VRAATTLGATAALAAAAAPAGAATCRPDTSAAAVHVVAGAPALRVGLNPAGFAGAFSQAPFVPEQPARTMAALRRLQPRGRPPLVLRLNRFFWSGGAAEIRSFAALVARYTGAGYAVELQLRYHPPAGHDGDVAGFVRWVRQVVARFGANPRVVGVQVTNEANLSISPDSSDGIFRDAPKALVQGVVAAHDEARRRGYGQLAVGFNWAYLGGQDTAFWQQLGRLGGAAFRRDVDWVGLDAYPGTFSPLGPGGSYADGMVAAMSTLRRCAMPLAGLGRRVPIRVEENGWPTGAGRPDAEQVRAMDGMIGAVQRFRGTYGITDYRWFDLRDHNSSSPGTEQHYGVLRDDYSPKPAFARLRTWLARLSGRPGPVRVALATSRRGVRLTGRGLRHVRRADIRIGGRPAGRLDRAPWRLRARIAAGARVSAQLALDDGRVVILRARG